MECVNENAQYIMIDRGDVKILVDVADISALQLLGEARDKDEKPVKVYSVQFIDDMVWQCVLDKETVDRYEKLKRENNERRNNK